MNLTFWSWVPGIQASVNLFNKTHPGIHVTLDETTSGNAGTYAKMFTALQAGNAPDLGQVEYSVLPNFEHVGGLVNLAPYGAASVKQDFIPSAWSAVTLGSAIYAIPQDTGPTALFYRADIFKKYHLPVPTTWAQYASDAATLHADNPNIYITAFPPQDTQWFSALAWQNQARWFSISGQSWVVHIDDAASMQVANYWQQLINKKLVKVEPDFADGWYHDLQNGVVATWPTAVWGDNTIASNAPGTKGDWRVAPMPQWSTSGAPVESSWGGSTTVVFKDTKHPQQAAEFAMWLNTNLGSWKTLISAGGLYPAEVQAQKLPEVNSGLAFFGGQNIFTVFRQSAANTDPNWTWGPVMSQTFTQMADGFAKSVTGGPSLGAVLQSVQSQTLSLMKSQGFSVRAG